MKKIGFVGLAIITFVVTLVATLFDPGTLINRFFAVVMCGVLSFDTTACTVNLAQSSNKVLATSPGLMEKVVTNRFEQLLGQRSGEFDNNPTPINNPQAPPYPVDPGPNFPIRRPDFDDDINNTNYVNSTQPNTTEANLVGIWLYSMYLTTYDDEPFYREIIEFSKSSKGLDIKNVPCNDNCSSLYSLNSYSEIRLAEESKIGVYQDITIEIAESLDGQSFWGAIRH